MEGNAITAQTIFGFDQVDVGEGEIVIGYLFASGVMPAFMKRLERYGFKISPVHFLPSAAETA